MLPLIHLHCLEEVSIHFVVVQYSDDINVCVLMLIHYVL